MKIDLQEGDHTDKKIKYRDQCMAKCKEKSQDFFAVCISIFMCAAGCDV
jgi:hypothetical protein